jgi:hypothetical protein
MKAYRSIKGMEELATKEARRFLLPYRILFGKGLNGNRDNTASGGKTRRQTVTGGEAWSTK